MPVEIGNFQFSEVWDGVLYKKLSAYPHVTDWEIRNLTEFDAYERSHGRDCPLACQDPSLLEHIRREMAQPERYATTAPPRLITECTACLHKGCRTEFVCHTTALENAVSILRCGSLLSAARARQLPPEVLAQETRNAANDPPDYFQYIMFTWGNCQAGDRLVMERTLGRFPTEEDLSLSFTPGVRFYFRYDSLIRHPNRVFDGVLPLKIRDELALAPWLHWLVIPECYRDQLSPLIPGELKERTLFVEQDCPDIWYWTEKIYGLIEAAK